LSRRQGATLFMTLFATFQVLLNRYTAQEDMLVGVANANRNRLETEGLIGFFINMLVLRTDLSGNPRFLELLARVRDSVLGAYAHQDMPFDRLIEELEPERRLSHTPLIQVAFGVRNAPMQPLSLGGLKLELLEFDSEAARFDLTLWVSETPKGLQILWTYSKDLFEEATIKRMHGHFEVLLRNVVAKPEARLHGLEISSEAEKDALALEEERWERANIEKMMVARRRTIELRHAPALVES